MIKLIITSLTYIIILFNCNSLVAEEPGLKVGLLAPFSGEHKDLGQSLLLSTQLALNEINDDKVKIIPRDSGSNNKEKLNLAIKDIESMGAKIIIGPISSDYSEELKKYKNIIFISPSNIEPVISNNLINIGISLESQLNALKKFMIEQKRKKTIVMYPKNEYEKLIDEKIKTSELKNFKVFKYSPDPKLLTGEIEKLTNYAQRKKNLEIRKKLLEKKDDENSKRELIKLEELYTLGKVNFDSIIVIDFGSSLKSVLTSLVFSDVDDEKVMFTTVNQWFDQSIFF